MDMKLHNEIYDHHFGDWVARNKDEANFKTICIGTMFNPDDLLCRLRELSIKNGDREKTQFSNYVEVYRNRKNKRLDVFITIPALDEYDNSTLESEFSTNYFRQMRDNLLEDKSGNGNYFWQSTFMQNPISPTGLAFGYNSLQIYDELPKDDLGNFLTAKYSIASLDPNRKGNDYVSMPILIPSGDKYYLVNCLFRQGALKDMLNDIVDLCIKYRIKHWYIEVNTDTSLPTLLQMKFNERKWNFTEIHEVYSTINKETRIKDHQGDIKSKIFFPDRKKWRAIGSEMGTFMEQMISFSFDKPNVHDDAIDSICMVIMERLSEIDQSDVLELIDRRLFGI